MDHREHVQLLTHSFNATLPFELFYEVRIFANKGKTNYLLGLIAVVNILVFFDKLNSSKWLFYLSPHLNKFRESTNKIISQNVSKWIVKLYYLESETFSNTNTFPKQRYLLFLMP